MNNIRCELEERTSKAGNKYKVLVIDITDNVKKLVFLSEAELELLQLCEE